MKIKISAIVKLAVALIPILISTGWASSVREVSMDEMIQQSQLVFEGTAIAMEAKENSQGRIHTYVTFEIQEVIKGKFNNPAITLRFLGGTVGDVTMAVGEMQLPQVGEHGIYFVESLERLQVHPLYGWSQGHFLVEPDPTGIDRVMTNKKQPVIDVTSEVPSGQDKQLHLSDGVARGVAVIQKERKTGLTPNEFKKALREKMRTRP